MKTKLIIKLLMLLCIILYEYDTVFAHDNHREINSNTVILGTFDAPPFVFKDTVGNYKGFFIDIITEIAKKENWTIQYHHLTWNEGLEHLKSGYLDIWPATLYSEERSKYLDYNKESILVSWVQVYTYNKSGIYSVFDIKDKKVGVMRGDLNNNLFRAYITKLDIPCEFIEYDKYIKIFNSLEDHNIDVAVANSGPGDYYAIGRDVRRTNIIINPNEVYFVSPKGKNLKLLKTIDKYVIRWKKNESSIYYESLSSWFGKTPNTITIFPKYIKYTMLAIIFSTLLFLVYVIILRSMVNSKTKDIEESKDEYKSTLYNLLVGVVVHDSDANVILCNHVAVDILGLSEKQMQQKTIGDSRWAFIDEHENKLSIEEYPVSVVLATKEAIHNKIIGIIRPDKDEITWAIANAIPMFNSNNELYKVIVNFIDITKLKNTELELEESTIALHKSEEFIRSVMDNLPIGVAVNSVDPTVNFSYMNDAFPKHYHTTRECLNVFDNFWNAVFEDSNYREWIKAKVIEDCASGDPSKMHWDAVEIKKHGRIVAYVNTANTPFNDKSVMISTVIDVTKKIQIQQELKASEQLLYTTNKLAKVGGWELYTDFSMKFTKELYHMYEIPFDEEINLNDHLKEFFPNNYKEVKSQLLATRETNSKVHFQLDFLTRETKTHKWIDVIGLPVETDGKIVKIVGANRDITELHQMMSDQKRMAVQLQQAQKMEAIGTLAGGISHDFNNVLSGILGYTELALGKLNKPEKIENYLNEILSGTDRAIKLVKQILTFSRLSDNGNGKQVCEISDITKEALDLIRSSIPATIDIKTNINTDALSFVDSTQIHQIVMNLCTNAYQAMRETGGILTVNLTEVEKTVSNNTIPQLDLCVGKYIQISIGDTGPGISEEVKEKMFDPYFTTKKNEQGTGLGLSVVQGITKNHHGCINVYSELGQGTIFNVYLPMCDEDKKPIIPKDKVSIIGTGTETIMVIDDELAIMNVVSEVLTSHGYIVFMFNDPLQAFEEFKKHKDRFDLIITDMTMPYMTGIELSQKILEISPGFPIILCTGYSELTNKEDAVELGIKDYLNKPLANQTLLKTVRHILDIHGRST